MFSRLGLPNPIVMSRLMSEWDELAGEPWKGRSRPLVLKDRTLVIEASAPSVVTFLRYGESALLRRLAGVFGVDLIERIEVRPPGRS